MSRHDKTIRVAEIPGELMRFRVESWSNPQRPHTVDLLSQKGFGECSCTDWVTRRAINARNGAAMGTEATMCRHIKAARLFFLNRLLTRMAQDAAKQR
jgi:hypothetical protein